MPPFTGFQKKKLSIRPTDPLRFKKDNQRTLMSKWTTAVHMFVPVKTNEEVRLVMNSFFEILHG